MTYDQANEIIACMKGTNHVVAAGLDARTQRVDFRIVPDAKFMPKDNDGFCATWVDGEEQ